MSLIFALKGACSSRKGEKKLFFPHFLPRFPEGKGREKNQNEKGENITPESARPKEEEEKRRGGEEAGFMPLRDRADCRRV